MTWTHKNIRRLQFAFATVACCTAYQPAPARAQVQDLPPQEQQQQVDAATKKLLAANGLYSRSLYKLAADEYGGFLAQWPAHAQATAARYALAVCRYRLGEFPAAVDQIRQVLADAKFDQRDEALAVLGHCELSQEHFEPAVAAFDELLAKYATGKHAELATLSRAQALYLSRKYPQAAKGCEDYLSRYPSGAAQPDALYFLALSQRAQDQNAAAVQTLARLNDKFPDSAHRVDALLLTGQALEALGKFEGAAAAYEAMLAAAPPARKPDALYSLGVACYKAGKYEPAARHLSALTEEFPDSAYAKPARLQTGLAQLAAGQTGPARSTLTRVAQQDPARANEAQYGLAQCDIAEKRYQQAAGRLAPLMSVDPSPANAPQIALDHAICLTELQKFDTAAAELQTLRDRYPNAPQLAEATYRQAFALHKLGKFDQSHALCDAVAKLKPQALAEANAELDAENLFLLARYPEARKQFAALAEAAKDDARRLRFTFRQGQCEYFAGDYAKAAAVLAPVASDAKNESDADLRTAPLLLGDALLQLNKPAEAAAPLERYARIAGNDRPQAQYKLGVARLRAGAADTAGQAFAQATEGPSDSPWVQRAWFERGQLELKDKHCDRAAESFRRAAASNAPPEVAGPATYQLGWAEFQSKRYPEAAAAWKQMASKYPKDKLAPDAEFQQGVALREAKQLAQSVDVLKAYAAAHPDGPHVVKANQLAAASLKDLGKSDESRRMLEALGAQAKGDGADSILYDLAWAQRDAKQASTAQGTYRRLIAEQPQSRLLPAARTELAELLSDDKRFDAAAALLEQVVADKSADEKILALAQYRLGWCYQELKKPQKAAEAFAAFQRSSGAASTPDLAASALLQAGIAHAADQKFDRAERALAEMLQKFPDHKDAPVAMLKLGEVQAEQNKYDAAEKTNQAFLDKYPKSEFAYRAQFGVGWSLENRKQYDAARAAYQKVIAATNGPTAARAQFQIGETYLAQGKFDQAVPALLAVDDVYKYPDWSARALFEAGRAFEQLKQPDLARKQYTDIVTRYKDAPEADMARERLRGMTGA